MHGFIITIAHNKSLPIFKYEWKPLFEFQPEHIKRSICDKHFYVEQFTSKSFLPEKNHIDCNDFFFVNEGIITNFDDLILKYNADNKESLLRYFIKTDATFFEKFRGNFAGFYWDKLKNEFYAFNNHTGTRKLFVFNSVDFLIVSTDLFTLSKTMDALGVKKSHDLTAAYFLLSSGFMHEDMTLIKEVKQVRAGEFVSKSNEGFKKQFYFALSDITENTDSEETIIKKIDELFKSAVCEEFEFAENYPYQSITTLSGGLDSRMVALMSHDLGFRNQTFLNFSAKNYADHVIAAQIAEKYKVPFIQVPLAAHSLMDIDDNILVNDGLTIYTGCSHVFASIKHASLKNIGIVHTGILGDGFMGSYLSSAKPQTANVTDGVFSKKNIFDFVHIFRQSISLYKNEELYKFYNRAFSGINTGFLYFNLVGETFSPFTNADFVKYSFSIPRHLKFRKKIYIKWLKSKHPEYADFIWESIGGKPTNSQALLFLYRAKRAIIKRLPMNSMWKNSMNPEQMWYDEHHEVKHFLDNYFDEHHYLAEFNKELSARLVKIYSEGTFTEKSQVLTLLGAFKLLFK